MRLAEQQHSDLDISSPATILEWTATASRSLLVRLFAREVAGNGNYLASVFVNDIAAHPLSLVEVAPGTTEFYLSSRPFFVATGETVSVSLHGQPGDTAVAAEVELHSVGDRAGEGSVLVDHDYGGADSFRIVTSEGAGIDNVRITAYLAADYAAGNRGAAFVIATATTDVTGRWVSPMALDAGSYMLVFIKQGQFELSAVSLVVEVEA